ncbi:hypothetical protein ACP4OV_002333 [Aristida adscensionis]
MIPPIDRAAADKSEMMAELAGATIQTRYDEKHVEATIEKTFAHGPIRMAIDAKGYAINPTVGAFMKSMDYIDKSQASQVYPLLQDFYEPVSRAVCANIMRSGFGLDFAAPGQFNHFAGPIAKSYVVCTAETAGKFNLMDGFDLIAVSLETYGELFAKSYVEGTKEVFMLPSRAGFVSIILPREMYGRLITYAVGVGETGRRFSGGGFYPSVVHPEPFYSQYGLSIAKTLGATELATKFFGYVLSLDIVHDISRTTC